MFVMSGRVSFIDYAYPRCLRESVGAILGLLSLLAQWLEHSVYNPGVASSGLIVGILTDNFSAGTRSSCVQYNYCTFRMRSQPQLRNDKYIMI